MPYAEHLTDDHIRAATVVYRELAADREIAFGIVSGSYAFGLGHGTSDVDFYVMAADGPALESRYYVREGQPVQVNVVRADKLDSALAWGADDTEFTAANRDMLEVQDDVRKLAIRLSRGHVVHANEQGSKLLARFDQAVMRRRVIARQSRDCGIHLEDVAGALAADDRNTAFVAARIAVTHACESVMAGCDDIYVGRKFLLRRLARIPALREVFPQIAEALDVPVAGQPRIGSLAHDDAAVVGQVLRDRSRLAGYLAAWASLDGWDSLLTTVPAMAVGDRGPVRSPYFTLLRFGDGIGLAGPDKAFRVSADAARLWLSLDGTRTVEQIDSDPDGPLNRGVAQLIKIGAVHECPE